MYISLAKGRPSAAFCSPFKFPNLKTEKDRETHGHKSVYKRRHTDKKVSTKGDTRTKRCLQKETHGT